MSGVRITDLTSTSNLGSGDYVAVDSEAQGTRKIGSNSLSSKVLDRLDTKTFSSLATAQKTILNAINELNARIDNIITPSGQASLSELVDVRVNFLGETFGSAGDAVRSSDLIASGYENTSITVTNGLHLPTMTTQEGYDAYSVGVDRYKGGKILIVRTSLSHPIDDSYAISGILDTAYVSNTQTPYSSAAPKASATSLQTAWTDHATYRLAKTYETGKSGAYAYAHRLLYILPIPEDFQYSYVWFNAQNEKAWDANWNPSTDQEFLERPLFVAYGWNGSTLTFDDPDSDGNIIIS